MPSKSGLLFVYNFECEKCLLYRVARFQYFKGFKCIEAYGKMVGTSELSVISWVSALEVCSLGRVPLYNDDMRL